MQETFDLKSSVNNYRLMSAISNLLISLGKRLVCECGFIFPKRRQLRRFIASEFKFAQKKKEFCGNILKKDLGYVWIVRICLFPFTEFSRCCDGRSKNSYFTENRFLGTAVFSIR